MPELPEVETVARDLRPLITGATIVDATTFWPRTLRGITPDAFADGIAGRRIESVGRRGKQLVIELSGDALMTIHLKMTGQLFVVPQGGPEDPYVRLVLALEDGRELRFRDIRKFGRIGLVPRGARTRSPAIGPEPLSDDFTVQVFRRRLRARKGRLKPLLLDQSFVAGVGNIYADEALWAARLHPLRTAPDASSAGRATPLDASSGGSSPRPWSAAARRSTTTPRPTATARCRSTCRSTSGPASRARAAAVRSGGSSSAAGRPTSARGASACRPPIEPARGRSSGRCPAGAPGPALVRAAGRGGERRAGS